MKKRLLFLGLILVMFLTGCSKNTKEYEENIYAPVQENVKKLDEKIGEYITAIEELRRGNEETDVAKFADEFTSIREEVSKVKPLKSFNKDETKKFEDMMIDFENALNTLESSAISISDLYLISETDEQIQIYNDEVSAVNSILDGFTEKFSGLNKEFKVEEKVSITNRPVAYVAPEKVQGQLNARENRLVDAYLTVIGTEEDVAMGVKPEFDKETRTLSIVFADNLYISDNAMVKETVTGISSTILTTIGKDFTVQMVQESKKDTPFIVVKDGEIIEDNLN